MPHVLIYTKPICPFCIKAKALLDAKGINFQEICIVTQQDKRDEMISLTGKTSVPQILINEKAIGGCDALFALEAAGKLDNLL